MIAMLSIGSGAESQAMETIDRMGLRNIMVRDKTFDDDELSEIREKSLGVSLRDAQAIKEGIPGVVMAVPRVEVDAYKIMSSGATTESTVLGVSHRQNELGRLEVQEGRFLDALDELEHGQVCVIGPGGAPRPVRLRQGDREPAEGQRRVVRGSSACWKIRERRRRFRVSTSEPRQPRSTSP